MSTRAFLIPVHPRTLELLIGAAAEPSAPAELLDELSASAVDHLRVVTVSERVKAAVEGAKNEPFLFAANCQPYLLATRDAEESVEHVHHLLNEKSEDALEQFFVEQAKALECEVSSLDREAYCAPSTETVCVGLAGFVQEAQSDYSQATGMAGKQQEDTTEREQAWWPVWDALARAAARLAPTWWQGRNRSISGSGDRFLEVCMHPSELAATRKGWERLPPNAEMCLALITGANFTRLRDLFDGAPWQEQLTWLREYSDEESAEGWRVTVHAASRYAEDINAHLIESDGALALAYRWPIFPSRARRKRRRSDT